jgi:hypothetical protein
MICSADWTLEHARVIGGLKRLARFLSVTVEIFDDGQVDVYLIEKDNRPVARLDIGPGLDVRLVSARLFDWNGSVDDIIERVLKPGKQGGIGGNDQEGSD